MVKTRCEIIAMSSIIIEKLLFHMTGIINFYDSPTDNEILQDYLNVLDIRRIEK